MSEVRVNCWFDEHSGAHVVAKNDFDAQRLRADTAEAELESEDFPPCDYCGTVPDYHPWHGAGLINGKESPHIHACTECRHKLPAPVAVVLPERCTNAGFGRLDEYRQGWNACLDATAALNGERK